MAIEFQTKVLAHGKTATFIQVPDRVMASLGSARRMPVVVVVRGHRYRSTVAPMGGKFLVPLNRRNREAAGVAAGQTVRVSMSKDTAPRRVEIPEALAGALQADPIAADYFASLSYTHQREYAEYVGDAKREDTRQRRAIKAVAMLRSHRREP